MLMKQSVGERIRFLRRQMGVSTDYILTGESYTLSDKEKMLVLLNE